MSPPMLILHLFTIFLALASASTHKVAKRIPQYDLSNLTIQDICGPGASDCGDGYCCSPGTECKSPSPPLNEYQCADLLYSTLTFPALAYASFKSLVDLSGLTSVGLTLSTVAPTTASTFTGFTSHSNNELPSTTWQMASLNTAVTATRTSTGAAVRTAAAGINVGVGMGILVGVGGIV